MYKCMLKHHKQTLKSHTFAFIRMSSELMDTKYTVAYA